MDFVLRWVRPSSYCVLTAWKMIPSSEESRSGPLLCRHLGDQRVQSPSVLVTENQESKGNVIIHERKDQKILI